MLGTALSPGATRVLLLGAGELGKEVAIECQRLGLEVIIASPAASVRRAAYLAELGWERLARGDTDNAPLLSPIYLQNP